MVSTLKLVPQAMRLLPIDLNVLRGYLGMDGTHPLESDDSIYYEPSVDEVLNVLVPEFLKGVVYGALVEAYTSEQSARMTAMDSATENADKMIRSLNLRYNRARQVAITQEISEIVGGASAL
jgi:F-type H+-transporting ATPase subunit gamma